MVVTLSRMPANPFQHPGQDQALEQRRPPGVWAALFLLCLLVLWLGQTVIDRLTILWLFSFNDPGVASMYARLALLACLLPVLLILIRGLWSGWNWCRYLAIVLGHVFILVQSWMFIAPGEPATAANASNAENVVSLWRISLLLLACLVVPWLVALRKDPFFRHESQSVGAV